MRDWDIERFCCLAVLFFLPVFVGSPRPAAAAKKRTYTISVSQFIRHPALDAVLRGFMDRLESDDVSAKYHVHIANGDQALNDSIAQSIAAEKPDMVLTISTPSSQACAKTLHDTTILFSAVTDPIGAGLVESLNKPGGKMTGMTDMSPVARQIELMIGLIPELKTIGVIYNPAESNSVSLVKIIGEVCGKQGIHLVSRTAENAGAVGAAAQSLVGQCNAIYVPGDNTVVSVVETVARICGKNRLPLFASDVDSVPRGAIATLAIDYYNMGLQTGSMAERLLGGESPSTMPVESLQGLRIHVNTKAAEMMGVELPVDLLQAADVIYDSFPDE